MRRYELCPCGEQAQVVCPCCDQPALDVERAEWRVRAERAEGQLAELRRLWLAAKTAGVSRARVEDLAREQRVWPPEGQDWLDAIRAHEAAMAEVLLTLDDLLPSPSPPPGEDG